MSRRILPANVARKTVPGGENKTSTNRLSAQEVSARRRTVTSKWRARRVGYEEKVPVKFGQLGRLSGLYFGCTGCARGKLFTAIELVKLYGTEGRVADLAKRLSCRLCKQRRTRPPRVYIEVSKPFYTKAEIAALNATDLDALVVRLEKLKPTRKVS